MYDRLGERGGGIQGANPVKEAPTERRVERRVGRRGKRVSWRLKVCALLIRHPLPDGTLVSIRRLRSRCIVSTPGSVSMHACVVRQKNGNKSEALAPPPPDDGRPSTCPSLQWCRKPLQRQIQHARHINIRKHIPGTGIILRKRLIAWHIRRTTWQIADCSYRSACGATTSDHQTAVIYRGGGSCSIIRTTNKSKFASEGQDTPASQPTTQLSPPSPNFLLSPHVSQDVVVHQERRPHDEANDPRLPQEGTHAT